jgi:dipeptidyl-peptidase-4
MRARMTICLMAIIYTMLYATTVAAVNTKPPLSLESIFSGSGFISKSLGNTTWNGDGGRFTFTRPNAESGLLDLFEYDVAAGSTRLVLAGEDLVFESKPVGMSRYQWANDKRFLLITGPQNRTWDSIIEAPHYVLDTHDKTLTALADGSSTLRNVYLSPKGNKVGYVLGNNLYITDLVNGTTRAVTTDGSADIFNGIFDYGSTEFGFTDAWHWSPDGRKIAFWRLDVTDVKIFYMIDELGKYSEVYPLKYPNTAERHAINQIGVFDLDNGETTWMDIGDNADDYIPLIGWTRSSQNLSIQRLTRDHKLLDVMLADTRTGKTRTVLSETDPAWIDITRDQIFFADSDKFVWTSEKSGYRHAYLYDYEGNATQLTDGNWEIVSLIAVDEDAGWLYFYAKKDLFTEQHVYRVKLAGSEVERLSGDSGWYEWNIAPGGRHVIETASSAASPPEITLRSTSGDKVSILQVNELEGLKEFAVPNPEFFEFETSDGVTLNAYMIKPTDFDPSRKYPVIVYGYGNAGSQMVVNRWGSSRGAQRDLWHRYMAQQGYIIFSMDNRTTAGRGKLAKNLTYGHYAKWAVLDQLEGVKFLKTLPYVDPERLGFWGWSGGGYLTAAMMTKGAPHYKTGVSVAPVIDLSRYQAVGVERWMGFLDENEEGYYQVNLLNFVERLEGDLLLIHGTGDENVKFAFTLQFADALIAAGKQFDMMVYPNEHHGIEGARLHVYTKIANYFKEKL